MKNILLLLFFFATVSAFSTPAPNFTVTTSDNQTIQLYQNFISQGKVVVIEAFFIACPPCGTHAPLFQNLYTQMQAAHPGKVEFIMLSTQSGDINTSVASYKVSKGLTMPAAGFDGGSTTALQPYTSGQFGQFLGTPTFIVIAPNTGEVHFDIRGNSASATITKLSQKIEELLPPPFVPTYCNLKDPFNNSLADVQLQVKAPPFDTTIMANGAYALSTVASLANKTYTIIPHKDDNPLNGLTTYDLVLISKHILGIEALKCAWQRLAADVNCSGSITTFDIVTARKVILGIDLELPCGSWRFAPDSATAMNGDCMEFLGVKSGDVTAGVCNELAPMPEDRETWHLAIDDRQLKAGETVFVTLNAAQSLDLQGFQADFSFDPRYMHINSLSATSLLDFSNENYNVDNSTSGTATVSWINPRGQNIDVDATVLVLEITSKKAGKLSEILGFNTGSPLRSEAYDGAGGTHALELIWRNADNISYMPNNEFFISPNPVYSQFSVITYSDCDCDCLIEVIDLQGKSMYQNSFFASKGYHSWQIDMEGPAAGLYFLRVNGIVRGKIVIW